MCIKQGGEVFSFSFRRRRRSILFFPPFSPLLSNWQFESKKKKKNLEKN